MTVVGFERDPRFGFETPAALFGDMLVASRDGRMSARLRHLGAKSGPLYATAGSDEQGGYADAAGGFLMPEALAKDVLRVAPGADPMARITPIHMTAPLFDVPARVDKDHSSTITGGLKLTRTLETVEATAARGAMELIRLDSPELAGLTYATSKLLSDGGDAFARWLEAAYRDALVDVLRTERIRGTGVGECLGVLRSPALITVSKEAGQAAATVVAPNVQKMSSRCWGYDEGATWIAHPELRSQLQTLQIPIGTAGSVALYDFARTDDEHDRLAGRPVFYDERASAPGTVGDLILGAWSEYLDAVWRPLQVLSSIHVRFVPVESAFRFYQRGSGAPWWRSALTPRNGTNTLSPFVTLEAR